MRKKNVNRRPSLSVCNRQNQRQRRLILVSSAAVAMAAVAGAARTALATAYDWGGADPGNWNVNSNWDNGLVVSSGTPGYPESSLGDTFTMDTTTSSGAPGGGDGGECVVTDTESAVSGAVYLLAPGTGYEGGPLLDIQNGGSLTLTASANSSVLNLTSNGTVEVDTGGTLNVSGGEMRVGNNGQAGNCIFNGDGGSATFGEIEMGIDATGSPTTLIQYNIDGGSLTVAAASGNPTGENGNLRIGKANNASVNQTGGTVTTAEVLMGYSVAGVTGTYNFTAGTLTAGSIQDVSGDGMGLFEVNGSGGTSITDSGVFKMTASGSELKVGLDAGGSTLINVTGAMTLGVATNSPVKLDVDSLAGFTGAGNVPGDPTWYRIAKVTGALTEPNLTLTSDNGISYVLENDPGYLTIGAPSLTWNDAGASAPADGQTWDANNNNNWNNGSSATTYSNGPLSDVVTFNDSNNSALNANAYNVILNTTVTPGAVTVNNSLGNYTISGTGTIGGVGSLTKSGTGTLTLSTANTYAGGTNVNGGTLVIAPTPIANTVALGNGAVTVGATGTLKLADNASASSPFVNSATDISNGLMQMSSLSIAAGGVLDVRNNHFYVADPGGAAHDSTFASLLGYVANGVNNPTGGEITSTEGLSGYGVGIVDGNDGVLGSPVAANQIEVAYTLDGDANLDGKVDITDFNIFAPNFGLPTTLGWEAGDFNYSGAVDIGDFNLFAGNFGLSDNGTAVSMPAADYAALDAFEAANGLSLTSVPEPASLGLLTFGAIGILARRRRKSAGSENRC